jgi:hypothetical protein
MAFKVVLLVMDTALLYTVPFVELGALPSVV